MRYRRVFPISLEGSIRASYEEALKKLREATELEKQAYQLIMEKNVLEGRLSIWDWLGKNLAVLSESLISGNYEEAKSLVQFIMQEIQRKYAEEQELLQKVQSGKSVISSISTPSTVIVYVKTSSRGSSSQTSESQQTSSGESQQTSSGGVSQAPGSQQTQTQQTQQTQTQQTQFRPPWEGVILSNVQTPSTQFSTPYTSIFAGTRTASIYPSFSPFSISVGTQTASIYPGINPFQQSGFYNPFR